MGKTDEVAAMRVNGTHAIDLDLDSVSGIILKSQVCLRKWEDMFSFLSLRPRFSVPCLFRLAQLVKPCQKSYYRLPLRLHDEPQIAWHVGVVPCSSVYVQKEAKDVRTENERERDGQPVTLRTEFEVLWSLVRHHTVLIVCG